MNNYKHGDWYCKHANEAEAHEIIERAVASGAKNAGGWEGTSITYFYGVFNGYVSCNDPDDSRNGTQYTIEQVREKFPLPSEREAAQWDGKGLPPVGAECEYYDALKRMWIYAFIVAYDIGSDDAIWRRDKEGGQLYYGSRVEFRPIRSERERWVEDVNANYTSGAHPSTVKEIAGYIFDAIKSGALKAPSSDK